MKIRETFRTLCSATALACAALSAHGADAYATLGADASGHYQVDPDHSAVLFSIGHAGVGITAGALSKVTGEYSFDPKQPAACKADITVSADTLDTFMPLRNGHLKSSGWLNVKAFPDIHFVSTRYTPQDASHGLLDGDLTLHGVTHAVQFKVTEVGAGDVGYLPKPWGGHLTGFVATTSIDRMDYGIDAYAGAVGHQIDIAVNIEGVQQ